MGLSIYILTPENEFLHNQDTTGKYFSFEIVGYFASVTCRLSD